MTTLAELGQEEFVLLTTYRRSGVPVSVPVWIAPSDGADDVLLVTTTARAGKVKRVRHNGQIRLSPCGRRGEVAPEAPELTARAEIVEAPEEVRALREAIRVKYGDRMKVTQADHGEDDPEEPDRVILRITADRGVDGGEGRRDDIVDGAENG